MNKMIMYLLVLVMIVEVVSPTPVTVENGGITIPTGSDVCIASGKCLSNSSGGSANISGSGTANYLSKFTAAGVIGNSRLVDTTTNLTFNSGSLFIDTVINKTGMWIKNPTARLDILGSSWGYSSIRVRDAITGTPAMDLYQTGSGQTNLRLMKATGEPTISLASSYPVSFNTGYGMTIGARSEGKRLAVIGGEVEALSPTNFASSILKNGNLTGGTNWTVSGDCAFVNNTVRCSYSTGTGTVQQLSTNFSYSATGNRWYAFTYTIAGATTTSEPAPIGTIATTFATTGSYIPAINGQTTQYVKTISSPTNFMLTFVLKPGQSFVLDNMSLARVSSGGGFYTGGGDKGVYVDIGGNVGIGTKSPTKALEVYGTTIALYASDNSSQRMCLNVTQAGAISAYKC